MTMQYLWRPLGLCTLAAALWIGVPSQANADASDMGPGTLLVARNDQQYDRGQGADAQYHRDGKAAKVKNSAKKAPKKDAKAKASVKRDAKKSGKAVQAGDNKAARGDKVARANGKKAKGDKVAHANAKKAKGDKAARASDKRSAKRSDAQRQAPQHFEGGEVNN
ncbi:MAG: hypothetical protein PHI96_03575 [Desulfovibrio sp.]|nr:hypothetical protein [Desulfovibrio sp.]